MKITDRLIGDHKTFRKLIKGIDEIAAQPTRELKGKRLIRLVELFKDHLILHAWGEDTFYYPAVRTQMKQNHPTINALYMDQLDKEHVSVDGLLDRLERGVKENPIAPNWIQTYQSFVSGLTSHMDKEEKELFPFSAELLGEDGLKEISNELERRRSEAPAIRRHASF
jgi:hemerythrin-like domain-containing protein